MKQRLLTALCFLLATWGIAKAQTGGITLTIPAATDADKGKLVTIKIANSQAVLKTGTGAYYPEFTTAVTPTVSTDKKTATYTIPYTDAVQTFNIADAANQLKDIQLTVDGKVISFKATNKSAQTFFDEVTSLKFTNNGVLKEIDVTAFAVKLSVLHVSGNELTALTGITHCKKLTELLAADNKLSEYHGLTAEHKALKKVDLSGNAIAYANIPAEVQKTIKENKGTFTMGTQTYQLPSATASSITNWYANNGGNSLSKAIKEFFGTEAEAKDFDFSWKKINENADKDVPVTLYPSTSTAIPTGDREAIIQDNVYPDKFTFRNNSKYFYGTYSVEIKGKSNTDYSGITYKIPQIVVGAAQFTFAEDAIKDAKVYLDNNTKTEVNPSTIVKQGQSLTVYAVKKEGMQLKEFEFTGLALREITKVENWGVFEVTGAVQKLPNSNAVQAVPLTLKALYAPAEYKLTVRSAKGGELQISYKDENGNPVTVRDGSSIPYGVYLDITVLTEDGYQLKQLSDGYNTSGGETPLKPEEGNANYYKLKVEKDVDLVPVFIKSTVANLTFCYPEGTERAVSISVNGESKTYVANKQVIKARLDDIVTVYPKGKDGVDLTNEAVWYIVAGTKRIPVVNGSATFTATGSMDVTLIYTPLQPITIIPEEGTKGSDGVYNHTITYSGKPYTYPYRTNPNTPEGNDGVEVNCRLSSSSPAAPNIGNPTNVGVYAFEFTRKADKKFIAATKVTARLTIQKATPVISELPTVTIENGVFKVKGGKALFNGQPCQGVFKMVTTSIPTESKMVEVNFVAADTHNFNEATAQVPVIIDNKAIEKFSVYVAKQLPAGVEEIIIKNGDFIVADGAMVEKDTKLTFETKRDKDYYYSRANRNQDGNFFATKEDGTKLADITSATETISKNLRVSVTAPKRDNPQKNIVVNQSILKQETDYTTAAQKLVVAELKDLVQEATALEAAGVKLDDFIFTYFDKEGNEIDLPVDAGTYKVTLYRPADEVYKAVNEEGRLVINPLTAKIREVPTASVIAQGQSLKDATLNGGEIKAVLFEGVKDKQRSIDVAGTFQWDENEANPTNGKSYRITFVPEDQVNFLCDATDAQVTAKVSNKMVVTWGNPQNGTVIVKVGDRQLESGDEIVKGEKLQITAVPNDGFEFVSLSVNGTPCSNGSTYMVGDASVAINATFKVKEIIVERPVPGNPTAVKVLLRVNAPKGGLILDKQAENVVDFGKNFSFSISTAAADKEKLSVVGGKDTQLASINGRFTLTDIKQDTLITITLFNPTPLKVVVEKETKNKGGYRLGTVEIENENKDSTYYYGEELVLIAYPESGVSFINWSDQRTLTDKYRTYVVKADATIRPVFSGTPTDIEAIDGVSLYGAEGCIVVKGIGEANITIVSMDGRIRKQQLSGDSRIDVAAGVYGIVLEQGGNVQQFKVIVR